MTVDLHGMTVSQARCVLMDTLKTCPKHIQEIEVIHGCNQGQALQKFVRQDFLHPKIKRKILTMNNGITILILNETPHK